MGKNKMTEKEMRGQICFYPYRDIKAVFERAEDAKSEPDELERLREFYRCMKFFYDFAIIQEGEASASGENLTTLYEYAKQGAWVKV